MLHHRKQWYIIWNHPRIKDAQLFSGKPRTIIATVINGDIKKAAETIPFLPVKEFSNIYDLRILKKIAKDRNQWENLSSEVCKLSQVNNPTSLGKSKTKVQ